MIDIVNVIECFWPIPVPWALRHKSHVKVIGEYFLAWQVVVLVDLRADLDKYIPAP